MVFDTMMQYHPRYPLNCIVLQKRNKGHFELTFHVSPAVVYFRLHTAFFQKTGDTCPAYAKKVRKKFGEYRFELGIKPEYAEKDAKQPFLEPLFKVQLPGDLPSKSVFKCSNFLLSWRRIL